MKKIADHRVTPLNFIQHEYLLEEAIEWENMHPDEFRWHYVQKALKRRDMNVSQTARDLGLHRRTLQRMLDKAPKRLEAAP